MTMPQNMANIKGMKKSFKYNAYITWQTEIVKTSTQHHTNLRTELNI